MGWIIEYTKGARKQLEALPKETANRVDKYLRERIAVSPHIYGKALRGNLAGHWRYRSGNYRIICTPHDEIIIIEVVSIGHRKDIYEV